MTRAKEEYRGLGPPVTADAANRRIDEYLAKTFPFRSRQQWKEVCERGELLVNGVATRAARKLKVGDHLSVYHPINAEPEVDDRIALLKEQSGVMAVYKPGNLPMHESGFFRRKTLAALVHEMFGTEWAPVHRLDRETSGVVLCAATQELRRQLSEDFETRAVTKRYLAIVTGQVTWDVLTVDQPLESSTHKGVPKIIVSPQGVPSTTEFKVLRRSAMATLLEAIPRTGRYNQIRAHVAWLGHHVIGDKIYHANQAVYEAYARDGNSETVQKLAGFVRHALHAAEISVMHPETKRIFKATSELPEDMRGGWSRFGEI